MSERGYIAVDRAIFDHPVFAPEPYTEREAWLWMIAEAVYRPTKVRVGRAYIELERGQLAYAARFLAAKWRWSEARVRRFFGRLQSDAMIVTQTTRDATLITICKYDAYQSPRRSDDAPIDAQPDELATQRRTSKPITKEEEPPSEVVISTPDPVSEMVEIYHEVGAGLWPKVTKLTAPRKASARRRLLDCQDLDGWRRALVRARGSPHLTGANDRGWVASFDFFMQEQSFTRVLEGYYDGRASSGNPQRQHRPASGHDNLLTAMDELLGAGHRRDERPADHAGVDDAYRDTAGVYRLTN